MPDWGQLFEAVRDIGFPAVIALLLFWQLQKMTSALSNDLRHSLDRVADSLAEVREVMVAVLEHLRRESQ